MLFGETFAAADPEEYRPGCYEGKRCAARAWWRFGPASMASMTWPWHS